jgi:hypothetical protein
MAVTYTNMEAAKAAAPKSLVPKSLIPHSLIMRPLMRPPHAATWPGRSGAL